MVLDVLDPPRWRSNRGRVLSLLGIIWVLSAYGLAVTPLPRQGLPHEIIPLWLRVSLWLVPGLAAIHSGLVWRAIDGLAWGLLILPISVYTASYLWGWFVWLWPGEQGGFSAGWRGAAVYAALGLLIYYCAAGLDKPPILVEGEGPWETGSQSSASP